MKRYSLKDVQVNIGGRPFKEQVGEIKISQRTKTFDMRAGNDGTVTLVQNLDQTHVLTLTMFQSSAGNAEMSAIFKLALESKGGELGIVPIIVKDLNGNSLFADLECVITGWPEAVYGNELGDRAWECLCGNPERFEGGN